MERTEMKLRIKKRNSKLQNSLTVTCGILILLCAGSPMFGQQAVSNQAARTTSVAIPLAPTPAAVMPKAQEEETAAQNGQGGSGIKIHGHWKFVVHNPDGTLASSREFENSLITPASGDFLLASALLGQTVPVDWGVVLCPVAGTNWAVPPYISGRFLQGTICPGSNEPVAILVPSFTTIVGSIMSFSNFCSGAGTSNSPCVSGMTQALTGGTTSSPGYSITLTGNYTSPAATTINAVGTYLGYCPVVGAGQFNTTSAATCEGEGIALPRFNPTATSPSLLPFTGTNQTQALAAGQILTVTVTISFS
jgi:hypothetical protein